MWEISKKKGSSLATAVQGLSALLFIEGLQRKGVRALQEVVHRLHPGDGARFTHVLHAASAIQTVSHGLVTELFFKPVIGNTNMSHLLIEMLSVQWALGVKCCCTTFYREPWLKTSFNKHWNTLLIFIKFMTFVKAYTSIFKNKLSYKCPGGRGNV